MKENKAEKVAKRVLPIYRATLDAWAEGVSDAGEVSCRKGCHHCCHNLVSASLAEGALVASHLFKEGFISRYKDRLNDTARKAESVDGPNAEHDYLSSKTPCAFLDDGECSIYGLRPSACRSYLVVTDPEMCSPERAGTTVGRVDASTAVRVFVDCLIRETHPTIPMVVGSFPAVVLAGLELVQRSPGSFKRWMARSELFESVESASANRTVTDQGNG